MYTGCPKKMDNPVTVGITYLISNFDRITVFEIFFRKFATS